MFVLSVSVYIAIIDFLTFISTKALNIPLSIKQNDQAPIYLTFTELKGIVWFWNICVGFCMRQYTIYDIWMPKMDPVQIPALDTVDVFMDHI